MFEKNLRIAYLLDFYGELLSPRQREVAEYSYGEDLSLSEIAALTGITRQGVRDSLKKAEEILVSAEESLGFLKAWRERQRILDSLEERLEELGVSDQRLDGIVKTLRS